MIRDFLIGLKRGFLIKPPDRTRLGNMADRLGNNPAFESIRRRELFKLYIELYMLKILGQVK